MVVSVKMMLRRYLLCGCWERGSSKISARTTTDFLEEKMGSKQAGGVHESLW